MAKALAIAVIHGMGSQEPGFAGPMIEEIDGRVHRLGKDPAKIAWKPIFWDDILGARQSGYLSDARHENKLDFVGLRRFVVSALGDAAAYQKVASPANSVYEDIHARVRQRIGELYRDDLGATAAPLIVMAHSLGGHIMSNYIWDAQTRPVEGAADFENMDTLAGIVTFGCNIPLFTFAYKEVRPIEFPAPGLPPAVRAKAKWLNFYDPDDVLGYPLKPINAAYAKVVTADIAINVGGIFTSWNPLSHGEYWTDNDFTAPVAEFIATFL